MKPEKKKDLSINPEYADLENPECFASVDSIKEAEIETGSAENVNSKPEEDCNPKKDVNSTDLGIHMISVYQSVTFEKSKHNLFYTDSIMPRKYPNVELTVRGDIGMVEIKSAVDHILIPYANVSCVYMQTEGRLKELEDFKEGNKSKHVHTESDIKRPR